MSAFQMAEIAIAGQMFQDILRLSASRTLPSSAWASAVAAGLRPRVLDHRRKLSVTQLCDDGFDLNGPRLQISVELAEPARVCLAMTALLPSGS